MEKLMEISTGTIAFSTILGVGGALGSLMLELHFSFPFIFFVEMFYILGTLIFIMWLRKVCTTKELSHE
ncbi:TPA: hypothetical protein HA249_04705 [Candidatus Woesearchaeota archaeon]|nr:hypothetical protein [Candidatus Woesearchaeota archaeon]HIH47427.1 hypothetical protein [Candidatus Woesearchaeota archaeon]HII88468.1 hypothetical protein [Candidatus Woesearchaeota archaeon]